MREALDILAAFESLVADQVSMSLATIVAVEGSSYRRPGARMLIAADGRRFGTVSGGCLEADVARRAQGVIESQRVMLCRYETGDDPDQILHIDQDQSGANPGVALGCGGVLEILIEPLSIERPGALSFFQQAISDRHPSRTALIYRVGGTVAPKPGTIVRIDENALSSNEIVPLACHLQNGFHRLRSKHGWIDLLIEAFTPPRQLLILGDGPDVLPLLDLCKMQGWQSVVAGYRAFAKLPADVLIQLSDHAEAELQIDPSTAVVVMTHDLHRDARLLRQLAIALPAYVGVLGPLHRTRRLLAAAGVDQSHFGGRLFAPVGLDLGGEGPQRVALSIISEIAAVLAKASAIHLRDKDSGIHEPAPFNDVAVTR